MKVLLWTLIADDIQFDGHLLTRRDFSAINILLLGELNIPYYYYF